MIGRGKCEPSMKRPEFDSHKLPVWVHLSHIPLQLYTSIGLSYVARVIGVPFIIHGHNYSWTI